jgi:hypothetical protein
MNITDTVFVPETIARMAHAAMIKHILLQHLCTDKVPGPTTTASSLWQCCCNVTYDSQPHKMAGAFLQYANGAAALSASANQHVAPTRQQGCPQLSKRLTAGHGALFCYLQRTGMQHPWVCSHALSRLVSITCHCCAMTKLHWTGAC